MFKNVFLKTLLNIFLLNYKSNLSRKDFSYFWIVLLIISIFIWLFLDSDFFYPNTILMFLQEEWLKIFCITLIFTFIYKAKKI